MTAKPKAAKTLQTLLDGTRAEELDCDRFLELLAPYLDGRVDADAVREQIEHHAKMCPECKEEFEIIKRALNE
jgi:hypothetical protein